jgi:Ca2+-binding RTX toxin-like protein
MGDFGLAEFGNVVEKTPSSWSWITPDGHDIDLDGSGLTYTASGAALGGTINRILIDTGNDSPSRADIEIRNIAVDATELDDGTFAFWETLLPGDDTLLGPLRENAGDNTQFFLFGDALNATGGAGVGGGDVFRAGDASVSVAGDVSRVESGASYRGGEDDIFGAQTGLRQSLAGDVSTVDDGTLTGGDDVIIIRSANTLSFAVGDATSVFSDDGAQGTVFGGDDRISAEEGSLAKLIGDVLSLNDGGLVEGGNDTVNGGEFGELITGDVHDIDEVQSATVIGGNDTLNGNGGDDTIAGDVRFSVNTVAITGGDDIIHGGEGNDAIFGELAIGTVATVGGDDRLFGEAGDDDLFGQSGDDALDGGTGADLLDGGSGADAMQGGIGNDTYVVDDAGDAIVELAGQGFDTVETTLQSFKLGNNVERVNFTGSGNFVGFGNDGNNRFQSGAGNDRFVADAGADIYSGGAGVDTLDFRAGAAGAVLDFLTDVHGGAAAGDTYASIEKFLGSDGAKDTMTAGGVGRFVFAGFGGNDVLTGGVKNDQLLGGAGSDTLSGGADRDALDGGTGNDTMTGGSQGDVFVFVDAAFGRDVVTDFEDGLDTLKVFSAVADGIADFTITGNGTGNVVLTLDADPANSITLRGAAPITITNDDFVFF